MKTEKETPLNDDGYLDVTLSGIQEGVREAQGFSNDGKFVRQRDHLATYGKLIYFRILPPNAESLAFYRAKKTFPFASVSHGWFTHPTQKVDDGNGGTKSYRMFHISPKSLGEPDHVEQFLTETLRKLPGYLGAPEEEVHELVRIFRALYTNQNPKYRHLGGPKKEKWSDIAKKIELDYPGYTTAEYIEMAQRIRYIWSIYKMKYLMPIVMVSEELNEAGESVPLTNQAQILDFEGVIRNAIFHPTEGLLAQNAALTPAKAKRKKQPFGAYKQVVTQNPKAPAYDVILECFENRQFAGADPEKKGYADFTAEFRDQPTILAGAETFYMEQNRVDLLGEVRKGIRDETMIIDALKVHFGTLPDTDFDKKYESEGTESSDVVSEADEVADKLKKKEDEAGEDEAGEDEAGEDEALSNLTNAIKSIEDMPGVEVPEALLVNYKKLTGKDWGEEDEVEEDEVEEDEVEEDKSTKAPKKTRTTRKRADI